MTRSKRIKPILQVAERRERDAAKSFAGTQKTLNVYRQKLNTMKQYRDEYTNQDKRNLQSFSVHELRQKQHFLQQINGAIEMLEKEIERHSKISEKDQKQWLIAKQKMNSIENVMNKIHKLEVGQHERREQNEIDDLYSRPKTQQ